MSETSQSNPTPEVNEAITKQIQAVKDSMIRTVHSKYFDFIKSIDALPCDQVMKKDAYVRFNEGMMWMKEAILAAPFQLMPVATNLTPQVEDSQAATSSTLADGEEHTDTPHV